MTRSSLDKQSFCGKIQQYSDSLCVVQSILAWIGGNRCFIIFLMYQNHCKEKAGMRYHDVRELIAESKRKQEEEEEDGNLAETVFHSDPVHFL